MQQSKHDVWVGLFVMIGAAAIVFLALKAGNLLSLSFDDTYTVSARFDNIGGLKVRAPVKSAGVVVGRVVAIGFDADTYQARVEIDLERRMRTALTREYGARLGQTHERVVGAAIVDLTRRERTQRDDQ